MTTALSDLRESVGAALTGDGVFPADATVLVDTVDSLTPPAYLLVWGTPWMVPATFCVQSVRLDVVCIAGRIDPAPGVETLETMVAVATNRLREARYPEATVLPPGPFEIGGVRYLAARVSIDVRLPVPEPLAAPISTGGATLVSVATMVVAGSSSAFATKSGAAVLVSVATLTVTGSTAPPPTSTAAATLVSAGTLTGTGSTSAPPVKTGAATLTSTGTLGATGSTFAPPPWTPASLSGLLGWYDGSDTATITASAGRVSQWGDKSSAAHPLVQATGARQPQTGVATLNGLNVVTFDATTRGMAAAYTAAQPITIYAVLAITSANGGFDRFFDGGAAGARVLMYRNVNWMVTATTAVDTGRLVSLGNHNFVVVFNGAASAFYDNGTQYGGTMNVGAGGISTPLYIGSDANTAVIGGYAEIVVQAGAATSGDRAAWAAYTLAKWGV